MATQCPYTGSACSIGCRSVCSKALRAAEDGLESAEPPLAADRIQVDRIQVKERIAAGRVAVAELPQPKSLPAVSKAV